MKNTIIAFSLILASRLVSAQILESKGARDLSSVILEKIPQKNIQKNNELKVNGREKLLYKSPGLQLVKSSGFKENIMKGQDRGGGDIACENQIKLIRDDIGLWIQKGGYRALDFKGRGTAENYKESMLEAILKTKIQCVGEGDHGYPVIVYDVPKSCVVERHNENYLMTCDFKKLPAIRKNGSIS